MQVSMLPRFLEGEPLLYNGWIWIVKGIQHPGDYVIAYPRYCIECIPPRKLYRNEYRRRTRFLNWSCIDLEVPIIPRKHVKPLYRRLAPWVTEFMDLLIELSGVDPEDCLVTGSLLIGEQEGSDIDLVFYGDNVADKVYDVLKYLRESGTTSPLGPSGLLEEYGKHKNLSISQYFMLRGHSLLQGYYMSRYRYTIRLVPYTYGFMECIDPVIMSSYEVLSIKVIEAIKPYTTPAVYRVRVLGTHRIPGHTYMVSFRIRYTELVEGAILRGYFRIEEHRNKKYYVIPDHSPVKLISINL